MSNDLIRNAIAREASIAAEHICIGVTALGKSNYAQQAYYGQAFFALSVGFERTAKLALIIDHAQRSHGAFPSSKTVRQFSHNLKALLKAVDDVSASRGLSRPEFALPSTPIHQAIIDVLTDFADNRTRYYDLDYLTGAPTAGRESATAAWHTRVTQAIVQRHRTERHKKQHEQNALGVHELYSRVGIVRHSSETGDALDTFYDATLHANVTDFAKPWARLYVLQIARFLGLLMTDLGHAGYSMNPQVVPDLGEFYGLFYNPDSVLRRRRSWSIYP